MHINAYIRIDISVCTNINIYIHIYIYICICTRIYVRMQVHTFAGLCDYAAALV